MAELDAATGEARRGRRPDGAPYALLLVDDEESNLELLDRTLRGEGEIVVARNGEEAIGIIDRRPVDLLITDQRMPAATGIMVVEHLKIRNPLAIRILLTAYTDSVDLIAAINRGEVYRYLTKPWDPQDLRVTVRRALEAYTLKCERHRIITELEEKNATLAARARELRDWNATLEKRIDERTHALADVNQRLAAAAAELSVVAQSDALTGLWNARSTRQEVAREVVRARRFGKPFSLLYVDVDCFTRLNERFGHMAGDRALRLVAGVLIGALKHIDAIGRFGGEEFLAAVPHATRERAVELAEQVRAEVHRSGIPGGGTPPIELSVSIGIATFPDDGGGADELVRAAQEACRRASEAGGNCVR